MGQMSEPDYDRWELENRIERYYDEKVALREALDCLVAVVGLTAFEYEEQRSVLQEAIDKANEVLRRTP